MRHFLSIFFLVVLSMALVANSSAQSKANKKALKKAEQNLKRGNFEEALDYFLQLHEDPSQKVIDEALLDFQLGLCYYHTTLGKEKAIEYLENHIEEKDSVFEAHYFLAKSYHYYHRFEDAIQEYKIFRKAVKKDSLQAPEVITEVLVSIDHEIERCNYGKTLINNPSEVVIENLGERVNTSYKEYAPVISPDETKLVFTRRSPETTGGEISDDGDYYEDIYISKILEGSLFKESEDTSDAGYKSVISNFKVSEPEKISSNINSLSHEGAIQFSYDGKQLYIYRHHNIWVSNYDGKEWSTPRLLEGLKGIVNTDNYEPSVSISVDGDVIFISSDRPGGFGGLDIYKSVKQKDGSWGPAVNLGPNINTRYDEDSPYIDPDGKTLYFSSKGHSSMGGFDVFKTQFKGTGWKPPQNMGYPINSAGDDIFYMMTPRYNRGYYSSNKYGGYGKMDLYRLTFANERAPLAEVKGLVKKGDTLIPTYSKITIYDPVHEKELSSHYSDSTSGEYLLLVAHGKEYTVKVETDGFAPYIKKVRIPGQVYYYQFYQEIHHVYLRDRKGRIVGQKVSMQNAFFDVDKELSKMKMPEEDTDIVLAKDSAGYSGPKARSFEEFVNKMDTLPSDLNFKDLVDVKFYMPEDSVRELVKRDTVLQAALPKKTVEKLLKMESKKDVELASNSNPMGLKTRPREEYQQVDISFYKPPVPVKSDTADTTATPELIGFTEEELAAVDFSSEESFIPSKEAQVEEEAPEQELKERPDTLPNNNLVLTKEVSEDSLRQHLLPESEDMPVPDIVVEFGYDQSSLKDAYLDELNKMVKFLKENEDLNFKITGHTDSKGSESYNQKLSKQRAETVVDYLSQHGISKDRLEFTGKGESEPIAPNVNPDGTDNPEGRKQNRRVEFELVRD